MESEARDPTPLRPAWRHPPPTFDRDGYARMKIPRHLGEAISGVDDPLMVPASEADHMRPEDYVIGVVVRGEARAYPIWVIDNYHVVNDRAGDERFIVVCCERCGSGSAFISDVSGNEGRDPLFRSVGFLNATLILKDLRTGSHWIHWEGYALDRRAKGTRLPWIPAYHMEWADWVALHPETVVMAPPVDVRHPDARHGHGREEFFSRPGMDPAFLASIIGPLDTTYPENEMVLVIEGDREWFAYPLREVQREGRVVHDRIDGSPVVVFAGPRPDGFTMSAFVPRIAGRDLTFEPSGGAFRDRETGCRWNIEGVATEGAALGQALEPIRWFFARWHSIIYPHRNTRLFRSERKPPRLGAGPTEAGEFEPFLWELAARGHEIRIGTPIVSQRRPREAVASLTVYVDGDRIHLHRFGSQGAARDYEAFEGAWSGLPLRNRATESSVRRFGRLVVESDPEERFADPAQIVAIPFRSLDWSPLLDSPALEEIARETGEPDEEPEAPCFADLVRALRLAGFDVIEVGFLPPGQLRVGCVIGIALTVEGDRFLLYRFDSPARAAEYVAGTSHAFAVGPFVMRSTPDTMYAHQLYEILYVGDDKVRWSPLVDDPALRRALGRVVDSADGA